MNEETTPEAIASTNLLAPLGVRVEGDELVIRIGCARIDGNDDHPEIPELPITDPHQWARDIADEMSRDRGDGATPLSLFIDEMIHEAVSMGASGIDHGRLAEIRRANIKTEGPAESGPSNPVKTHE